MQALQAAGTIGSADAARKLRTKRALLGVRPCEARAKLGIPLGGGRPALHAAARLDTRDLRAEVPARQPELRRKRRPAVVERRLLGDCGQTERAANGDSAERARRAAELALDDCAVVHARNVIDAACARPECPSR